MDDAPQDEFSATDGGVSLGSLGQFFGFRLRRIQNRLSRDFTERTREMGLRGGTVSALGIILANPGINQVTVARSIGLDASAAVALLEDLRKRGWITRTRQRQDRRQYAIRLTASGEIAYREMLAVLSNVEGRVMRALDEQQLALLSELLDTMFDACSDDPPAG